MIGAQVIVKMLEENGVEYILITDHLTGSRPCRNFIVMKNIFQWISVPMTRQKRHWNFGLENRYNTYERGCKS